MYRRKSHNVGLWLLLLAVLLRVFFMGGLLRLQERAAAALGENPLLQLMLAVATGTELSAETQEVPPRVWVLHRASAKSGEEPDPAPEAPTAAEAQQLTLKYGGSYRPSAAEAVETETPVYDGDGPAVLIVHTHTTEAYAPSDGWEYEPSDRLRTLDAEKNVVRVGEEIAAVLSSRGIEVLHDKSVNDYPDFNSAYGTTAERIAAWLEQYPTIQAVIDVHRDAVEYADGTAQYLSATLSDGTVSAPLMLVVGTDEGGLHHPNWQENFSWAVKLQCLLERENAGICRSLNLRTERFNGHFTPKSILLEVGTTGNTLPEALAAARAFGESFADLWEMSGTK